MHNIHSAHQERVECPISSIPKRFVRSRFGPAQLGRGRVRRAAGDEAAEDGRLERTEPSSESRPEYNAP